MNALSIEYDTLKCGDTSHSFVLSAAQDGITQTFTDTSKVVVKVGNANLRQVTTLDTLVNEDGSLIASSANLAGLPAGQYSVELWQTTDTGVVVYPSNGQAIITLMPSIN
ncbi:hypothetical protein BTH95_08670 [Lactobacillus delbrueckii subsp. bulgaricus]|nr:hypothetical protein [Lactobacillus delbrueckii subsp. bulgaricus]MBT8824983.1 hypothetical protein [Lactobacillus delbrueckii subsp. bulgaricus]MBT8842064.1 hypothetical protein [Lactobacillus delbrueckii subsp. bulgaricus]MBT8845884.1 hypothetical protein [Lactobacillus delbrueckii subsp. bulgaricus]